MRAAWALAQSLLLLDLKTGEVYEGVSDADQANTFDQ